MENAERNLEISRNDAVRNYGLNFAKSSKRKLEKLSGRNPWKNFGRSLVKIPGETIGRLSRKINKGNH